MKVYENHCSISTSLKLKVLGIDIGIGIFNTFQMEKSIEVLGIQYNFLGILVLGIQYFKKVLTHTLINKLKNCA